MPRFPFQVSSDVPVFLAPMAGVSESPFRRLCRRFGADVVVYSATKFAVRGLTEALDLEWSEYGIRVMDVLPLFVATMSDSAMLIGLISLMLVLSTDLLRRRRGRATLAPGTAGCAMRRPGPGG